MIRHIAATLAILAATAAGVAFTPRAEAAQRPSEPCAAEDSSYCVWHAPTRGNGEGHSFWTGRKGRVHRVSHARALRMLGC